MASTIELYLLALQRGGPWQDLGTLTGYTINWARYRLLPDGNVLFDINVIGTASHVVNPTFSATLPAEYQPPHNIWAPLSAGNVAPPAIPPSLVVYSSGIVYLYMTANATNTASGTVITPTT